MSQINSYYSSFLRTPCGNSGESEIGLPADQLASLLMTAFLDWPTADAIRSSPQAIRLGCCSVDVERAQLTCDGSGRVHPFTAIELLPDGTIETKTRGTTVAVIGTEEAAELAHILDEYWSPQEKRGHH
jgi:hypothetical protein